MPVEQLPKTDLTISRDVAGAGVQEDEAGSSALERNLALLERSLQTELIVLRCDEARVVRGPEERCEGLLAQAAVCGEVARRGRPEFIAEEDPLILLAVPLDDPKEMGVVALGVFLTRTAGTDEAAAAAARLGMDAALAERLTRGKPPWNPAILLQMAELAVEKHGAQLRAEKLQCEVEQVTSHLLLTYEEISLLHRLTQNLKLSHSGTDLGWLALEWLDEVLPARCLAIKWKPTDGAGSLGYASRSDDVPLLTYGNCPVEEERFDEMLDALGRDRLRELVVLNPPATGAVAEQFPKIREVISVPLAEGDNLFGWLMAFNHRSGGEFGTVEASLLSSVGTILGIHRSNIELYRQQAEFLASVVRALTSAIDAKDPYTCGHSDRVARVAVRLAEELGLDATTRDTIYMGGLLHDIGKIGIDDNVLRKPGKLTEAEYEHIKLHPELGYKILKDLKQLDQILPVVLHHHEAWDGTGYPHALAGEAIPLLARIVAVADSFDAMSSDRPYRQGMPSDKLEAILKAGADKQWDAKVVAAFFQARDDIHRIVAHSHKQMGSVVEREQLN